MLEMEETIQAEGCADRASLEIPTLQEPTEEEPALASEIGHLWEQHRNVKTSIQQDRKKVSSLRAELGQRLIQMKEMLARPGRNGQWSAWLKQHKIPRASADRLVAKHARSLNPEMNCLSESISESTEETIAKLVSAVASRVRKTLPAASSLYDFLDLLTSAIGLEQKETAEGILIVRPEAAECQSSAVSAAG